LERADFEQAFRRLKEKRNRWRLGAEGYAILAVAAYETGRDQLTADLIEDAEYRGADMSALKAVRDSRVDA
jgi:hypothetical protein